MKTMVGVKTQPIENNEYLHFWYANNRSRGTNNVTVIRSTNSVRSSMSRNQTDIVASTLTCGWRGHVNLSRAVLAELGL